MIKGTQIIAILAAFGFSHTLQASSYCAKSVQHIRSEKAWRDKQKRNWWNKSGSNFLRKYQSHFHPNHKGLSGETLYSNLGHAINGIPDPTLRNQARGELWSTPAFTAKTSYILSTSQNSRMNDIGNCILDEGSSASNQRWGRQSRTPAAVSPAQFDRYVCSPSSGIGKNPDLFVMGDPGLNPSSLHQISRAAQNLKKLRGGKEVAPFNLHVLKSIAELGQGGKYSKTASRPFNNPLTLGKNNPNGSLAVIDNSNESANKPTYCSSATYTAFLKTMERVGAFDNMKPKQLEQFAVDYRSTKNFWGLWNNGAKGDSDACRILAEYCETFNFRDNKEAMVPGDFLKINRNYMDPQDKKQVTSGHSAIFLGWADKAKTKVMYWSSHGSTGGYGVKIEDISHFDNTSSMVTRITNPSALQNIPPAQTELSSGHGGDELDRELREINRSAYSSDEKYRRRTQLENKAWTKYWRGVASTNKGGVKSAACTGKPAATPMIQEPRQVRAVAQATPQRVRKHRTRKKSRRGGFPINVNRMLSRR